MIKDLLYEATIERDYEEVDHLIDCSTLQFSKFRGHTIVSFHPTFSIGEGIAFGDANPESANSLMQKEFEKLFKNAKDSSVRGVLYAWSPDLRILQFCDVFITH